MWQQQVCEAFYSSIQDFEKDAEWQNKIEYAEIKNRWFSPENLHLALSNWRQSLAPGKTTEWLSKYQFSDNKPRATLGLIMAGNIPLVGMHDAICGLISGYNLKIKFSSEDEVLPKTWLKKTIEILPELESMIEFSENMKEIDLAIATGSNNSHKYFEYYFKEIPHLLRRNRNSVAVLDEHESVEDMISLGHDVFDFFGLGCRNVTKLFLPEGYEFKPLFDAWENDFYYVINHNKYANNFQYHRALLLMNLDPHIDNGFILLKERPGIYSPIGMLNYSFYSDLDSVKKELQELAEEIQCVISTLDIDGALKPGLAQCPAMGDYADGVDTMAWLLKTQASNFS